MYLNKVKVSIIIISFFLTSIFYSAIAGNNDYKINYSNQVKAEQYIQKAIYDFWHGNEIKANEVKVFKGITLRGKMGVVEYSFSKAAELIPYRLDLKFDLASTQILQGKLQEAIETYNSILKLDPNNFNAKLLLAVYSQVSDDTETYKNQISELQKLYPEKFKFYIKIIEQINNNFSLKLSNKPQKIDSKNNVIIILGYALNDDGTPHATLIERLQQGLAAYKLNPKSKIIVTGGMPHNGITESYVMQQWLIKHGVEKEKIYLEDQSKDTVGNAFFCAQILKRINPEMIILITSASHMRRAYSTLQTALQQIDLNISISNLVYLDYKSIEKAMEVTNHEKLVVFRDVLRCAGIWAYPGIQQ